MGVGSKLSVIAVLAALSACGSSSGGGDEHGSGGSSASGPSTGGAAGGGGSAIGGTATGGTATGGSATGGAGGTSGGVANGGSGGRGGTGTSGAGGSGTAGMSGMGGTSTPSPGDACVIYAVAFCTRSLECAGTYRATDAYACALNCPELMLAPGSTRTPEGLVSCAEEIAKLSCEDLDAENYPPCVSAGTKGLGEPCVYNSQCESRRCKVADACGICARNVGEGEDCSASDVACSGDLLCKNGLCWNQVPDIHEFGEPCADFTECDQLNGHCNEETGICERYPGVNESCAALNACQAGLYCKGPDKICTVVPGQGEPCGDDVRSSLPACAGGLGCTERQAADGTNNGTCVPTYAVDDGDSCYSHAAQCTGSYCQCDDTACGDAHCVSPPLLGDACTPDSTTDKCVSPLECVGGVCTAPSYRGDYEAKCMP